MDTQDEIESLLKNRQAAAQNSADAARHEFTASANKHKEETERKKREILAALQQIQKAFQPYLNAYQNGELPNPPKIELMEDGFEMWLRFELSKDKYLKITYNDMYIRLSDYEPDDIKLKELRKAPYRIEKIQHWIEGHDKGGYTKSKILEEGWHSIDSTMQKLKEELVTYVENQRAGRNIRPARSSSFFGKILDTIVDGLRNG